MESRCRLLPLPSAANHRGLPRGFRHGDPGIQVLKRGASIMSAAKSNHGFRILIVDDDESTRNLLTSILSAEGYESRAVGSVAAAEVILRQEPVHLAFIDLYLGTTNGLNVLDLIKVLQPQCACVIMTAHTSVETVTKSLGSGALEYMGKPLLIDDLLAVVRKVQASKRTSNEAAATVDE